MLTITTYDNGWVRMQGPKNATLEEFQIFFESHFRFVPESELPHREVEINGTKEVWWLAFPTAV